MKVDFDWHTDRVAVSRHVDDVADEGHDDRPAMSDEANHQLGHQQTRDD